MSVKSSKKTWCPLGKNSLLLKISEGGVENKNTFQNTSQIKSENKKR